MLHGGFSVTARFAQALVDAIARQGGQVPEAMRLGTAQGGRVDTARQEALWALFVEACPDEPLSLIHLDAADGPHCVAIGGCLSSNTKH